MSDDKEQNQDDKNDSENENLGENTEENTDVDIDQSNELSEDEAYKQELEKWFNELEAKYGIDYANKMREKIARAKEIAHFIDLENRSNEINNEELESLFISREQNAQLFKQIQQQIDDVNEQMQELRQKELALIEENSRLNRELYERAVKSFDDSDKQNEELALLVKQHAAKLDGRSKERHELKMQLLRKSEAD